MKLFSKSKNLNKTVINILGIKISYKTKIKKFLENVFKTNYKKKALIIYIINPFLGDHYYSHSNATESYIAAKTFSEIGYNVDVLSLTETKNKDFYSKYDVVYGKNIDHALFSGAKVIPYSGGTAHKNLNKRSIVRAAEFYKKSGLSPSKSMCDHNNFSLAFAYANILLGNNLVKDSFIIDGIEQNLYNIDGFYFDTYNIDIEKKDFNAAKKHFLWWGSRGAIHKGLDLTLNIFKQRPNLILHVCGFQENEKEFFEYYKKELSNEIPNIINHGFVDIKSNLFKELMNKCSSVISPSITEGGAIGIINIMANGGIIPIISTTSGLDVGHYGYMFDDLTENNINFMINKFLKSTPDEIKNLSIQVKTDAKEKYSIDKYKNRLKEILKEILND